MRGRIGGDGGLGVFVATAVLEGRCGRKGGLTREAEGAEGNEEGVGRHLSLGRG